MTYCFGFASVVVRRAVCVVRRPLTSSEELLGQSLPNLVCGICRVRRQEILNFITSTPRGGNFGVKSVKLMYFFKNLLLYSCASSRQTEYIVIMSKEASIKIVNFMTPGAGVPVMGVVIYGHIVKMHYFF